MPMRNSQEKMTLRQIIQYSCVGLGTIGLTLFLGWIQYPILLPSLLLLIGIHLHMNKQARYDLFLHLSLLLVLLVFMTHLLAFYTEIPYYYLPVAGIAMLVVLLFNDLELAFLTSFVSSLAVTMILGGDFGMMLVFFLGSLTGVYTVRDARTRGKLIQAGIFSSAVQVSVMSLQNFKAELFIDPVFTKTYVYPLVLNGLISTFFVLATLKLFEMLFGVLTNFSLMELADRNQPLLKRMALEAPGTWQHSLIVSQLCEAGTEVVGGNPLLARVGGYYHDIGKMAKSDYFTENQLYIGNKHDKMEPSMSRLVLLNHVKEGAELARKYKLNKKIIDFIPEHHGTGLMFYFYQRALEEAEEGETVSEEDYRYPGPKPQSKETGVILLADSVEGAVRALDEPTPSRIEETVRKVINNRFIDGQLDECELTLKDIDTISRTFIPILSAMYHGRVKYPDQENSSVARNGKKSSSDQKNTGQQQNDQNQSSESSEKSPDQNKEN